MLALISTSSSIPYDNISRGFSKPPTRKKQGQSLLCHLHSYDSVGSLEVSKQRRSSNYHPTIWDSQVIATFSTPYSYDVEMSRLEKLKEDVRHLLICTDNPCEQMKLIDSMQRLGVSYHFETLIKEVLSLIDVDSDWDLSTTSLHFRLSRQSGMQVSQGVFSKFRNEKGELKDELRRDLAGILSLYEASHLGLEGEGSLEEAKNICRDLLKSELGSSEYRGGDDALTKIQHSLDIPLHWRMERLDTRNFIDHYQKSSDKNSMLLELAILDYNLVQAVYQTEVKELSEWWSELNFKDKLPFTRDRLMENYLWSMGIVFEPQFSTCRIGLTKFVCILSVIDDIYDIYGSLDELELFTRAVNNWDYNAVEYLPEYMQVCYLAMLNFGNALVNNIVEDQGVNILPFIKNAWTILCGSYLKEARWFASRYTPTLTEYLENAWISVGGPSAIIHAYALQSQTVENTKFDCIKQGTELLYRSSLITRLSDDFGTSTAETMRGDVAKAIRCYMVQEDVSEDEAKDYIQSLIRYSWNKINEETSKSSLPKSFIKLCLNMTRTAQCIYQHGDGIGTSDGVTKDRLTLLVVDPIVIQ